jgi:uncharacterized protein YfaQ (DUF2300 family)
MSDDRPKRIYHKFTPEERARWEAARDEALALKPLLAEKARRLRQAAAEPTITGALRAAVHRHDKPLPVIAVEAGLAVEQLDAFLTGDQTLRSDVLDRLANVLGFAFPQTPMESRPKMVIPPLTAPPIMEASPLLTQPTATPNP